MTGISWLIRCEAKGQVERMDRPEVQAVGGIDGSDGQFFGRAMAAVGTASASSRSPGGSGSGRFRK